VGVSFLVDASFLAFYIRSADAGIDYRFRAGEPRLYWQTHEL
jgi:hypothetical protein